MLELYFLSLQRNLTQKAMKKLLGLGLALLCLTACSNDDEKTPTVNLNQLAKRWFYVSTKVGNQKTPYDGNLPCGKDYLEFQANNVVREGDYYDCQQDPAITTGSYTVEEDTDKLTTTIDGETIVYTITKLNSKEFQAETTFNNLKITYIFTSTP